MDPAKIREEIRQMRDHIKKLPIESTIRNEMEKMLENLENEANQAEALQVKQALETLPADSVVRKRLEETLEKLEAEMQSQTETKTEEMNIGMHNPKDKPSPPTNIPAPAHSPVPAAHSSSIIPTDTVTNPNAAVLARINRAIGSGRCVPGAPHSAVTLACHCMLLDQGFICTGSDDTAPTVKGFAAPIRDVPASFLLPKNWDKDSACVSLRYRVEDQKGKTYIFKSLKVGPKSMLHLGEKDGWMTSAEVVIAEIVNEENLSRQPPRPDSWFKPLQELVTVMRSLSALVIGLVEEDTKIPANEPTPAPQQSQDPLRIPPRNQPGPQQPQRDPLRDYSQPSGGPGIFSGDLDPFGGGRMGGGGLMGPNHPFFTGPDPSGGIPQPRFDPYGPSPGPDHLPAPGIDPQGRGRGRGRGRGKAPARPFGGIDPDHFQPPGGGSGGDMFM